jgi:hypothetical protein
MWQGVKWFCALVAMSCNSVPDITAIQTVYEREASAGSPLHDRGLQVLEATCHNDGTATFLCEVTFILKGDPERPYFDIIALVRAGTGWELKGGPDIAAIQTAYEREASAGSPLHDLDLQVLEAKCHADGTSTSLCEVTFISKGHPDRPYFDIITLARAGTGWELTSGLCKR